MPSDDIDRAANDLYARIRLIVEEMQAFREQAKKLGLFTGDRELLECSHCGLIEDVLFSGLLVTYHKDAAVVDSVLRFKELPRDRFRCPGCGAVIRPPDPPEFK